jgi:hypothetical protein
MDENQVENREIARFASQLESLLVNLVQLPSDDGDVSPWDNTAPAFPIDQPASPLDKQPARMGGRASRISDVNMPAADRSPKDLVKVHCVSPHPPPAVSYPGTGALAFRGGHTIPKALQLYDCGMAARRSEDLYEVNRARVTNLSPPPQQPPPDMWPEFRPLRSFIIAPLCRPRPSRAARDAAGAAAAAAVAAIEGRVLGHAAADPPPRGPASPLRAGAAQPHRLHRAPGGGLVRRGGGGGGGGERAALEEKVHRVLEEVRRGGRARARLRGACD